MIHYGAPLDIWIRYTARTSGTPGKSIRKSEAYYFFSIQFEGKISILIFGIIFLFPSILHIKNCLTGILEYNLIVGAFVSINLLMFD